MLNLMSLQEKLRFLLVGRNRPDLVLGRCLQSEVGAAWGTYWAAGAEEFHFSVA